MGWCFGKAAIVSADSHGAADTGVGDDGGRAATSNLGTDASTFAEAKSLFLLVWVPTNWLTTGWRSSGLLHCGITALLNTIGIFHGLKLSQLGESRLEDVSHLQAFWSWFPQSLAPRDCSPRQSVGRHKAVALKAERVPRNFSAAGSSRRRPLSGQRLQLGLAVRAARRSVARLSAVEAGSVLDVDLRLRAFLRRVTLLEAVRTGCVRFAQSGPLVPRPLRIAALFVGKSAPHKSA